MRALLFDGLTGVAGDMFVGGSQPASTVNHDDCRIRFPERQDRLFDHCFLDTHFAAGNATGVDNEVRNRPQLAKAVLAVACQPGIIRNERVTRSSQAIE